jgi:hypothetical protein
MSSIIWKSCAAAGTGIFLETKYGPSLSSAGPSGMLSLYSVTPLILIGTGFWSLAYGMVVGKARAKAIEDAKADGEKDVEERYGLPNLYAQGTSKHALTYNAVQRSHQHIFETFGTVVLTAMVGAFSFPISTALSTLTYAVGRVAFSNAYAKSEGDASKRYSSSKLSKYMWYGIMGNIFLGACSCLYVMFLDRAAKSYLSSNFSYEGMKNRASSSMKESRNKYFPSK